MKVAMFYSASDIRIKEMPIPKVGADEILVKMKACGICGSDLMEWYLNERAPLVLGHEPAGIVVESGEDVQNFKVGDRVFVHHHVACLTCHYCIRGDYTLCAKFGETHIEPGGFADFFKVPSPNLKVDTLKIPGELNFQEATLIEPVACCLRALTRSNIRAGDTVAVIGAGPSGLIHAMLARIFGASQVAVSDLIGYRLQVAEQLGVDLIVNSEANDFAGEVRKITSGRGADIVVVTAPNVGAFYSGLKACRKGGTLCLFAPSSPEVKVQLSMHSLFFSEIRIAPSYSTSHVETRVALDLISHRRIQVEKLVTHRFPLLKTGEAFELVTKNKKCLKVLILSGD